MFEIRQIDDGGLTGDANGFAFAMIRLNRYRALPRHARARGPVARAVTDDRFGPRRVLALLECRPSDDAVCRRAIELVSESGGYLTLVVVAPQPFPNFNGGPLFVPRVTEDDLHELAVATLARLGELVPGDVPVQREVDAGRAIDVAVRRVRSAAHDALVVRSGSAARVAARVAPVLVLGA